MRKKVAVTKEEMKLPYYKFFVRDLAKVPEEKLEAAKHLSAIPAVSFADRNLFLAGKDGKYCQVGYGTLADGIGFVCNATYMPDVTGEMMDWWFAWHSVGADLRYKIWDPEDHYFAKADNAARILDPSVPMNEKTWGVNHYIVEDTGFGPSPLKLVFRSPAVFGYDTSLIGTAACESLVCAIGAGNTAAAMTHKWSPYKDGILFCSRFWIGYKEENGAIVRGLPEGASIPEAVTQKLFEHNIKEFTNLASILPELYAEEKDDF